MRTDRNTTAVAAVTVIEAAIRFVAAQPDGAQRILGVHRRGRNGTCSGCATTLIRWPCAGREDRHRSTAAYIDSRSGSDGGPQVKQARQSELLHPCSPWRSMALSCGNEVRDEVSPVRAEGDRPCPEQRGFGGHGAQHSNMRTETDRNGHIASTVHSTTRGEGHAAAQRVPGRSPVLGGHWNSATRRPQPPSTAACSAGRRPTGRRPRPPPQPYFVGQIDGGDAAGITSLMAEAPHRLGVEHIRRRGQRWTEAAERARDAGGSVVMGTSMSARPAGWPCSPTARAR